MSEEQQAEPIVAAQEETTEPQPQPEAELNYDPQELERLRKRAERFQIPFNEQEAIASISKSSIIKRVVPDPNKEEERRRIEEREKRFGIVVTKPRNDKHIEQRLENFASEENPGRNDTLHVYGVDFLLNDDIKGYFRIYNPLKIEWINDSSCNVVFDSEETANSAYQNLTLSKNYDSHWRDSFPIQKEGLDYTLQMRFATQNDVKKQDHSGKQSKFYLFHIQQRKDNQESQRSRYPDNKRRPERRERGDRYNDRQGVMNKPISKNKRGKEPRNQKKKEDEEEKGDEELKELRENQIAEGEAEVNKLEESEQQHDNAAPPQVQETATNQNQEDDLEL